MKATLCVFDPPFGDVPAIDDATNRLSGEANHLFPIARRQVAING
jgi:hypothetical protein